MNLSEHELYELQRFGAVFNNADPEDEFNTPYEQWQKDHHGNITPEYSSQFTLSEDEERDLWQPFGEIN